MKSCKQTALKLIIDIENNRCIKTSLNEALDGLSPANTEDIQRCIFLADPENTIKSLSYLANIMSDPVVVAEFEDGTQTRFIYPENECVNVLRTYKKKGIKAWIELD